MLTPKCLANDERAEAIHPGTGWLQEIRVNTSHLLTRAMRWLGERGGLVASNVARADIPGARARDFEQSFAESIRSPKPGRLPPAATDARHLAPRAAEAGRLRDEKNVTTISQNQISVEDEMMKLADIGAQHQLVASIYRKNAGLLRLVVRGRS